LSEGGGKLVWTKNEKDENVPGLEFDRNGALCLQQTVKVEPGVVYHVFSRVRTEDVKFPSIAFVMVAFLDQMGGAIHDIIESPKGNFFTGTSSWTADRFETKAPGNAAAAEIRLFINGPGKVYINNINFFQ
ncbi:MAG: hypothetical protein NWF14_04040, partial [Candidatus Bathyarchaeota archaeon]|nr:hypothetical protein [Candidatus Bathyarchaeota archaeon]